ncbi:helix-turn-helix transcriptional regulator [Aminipila butyrica]|uniref:Helix-turn-helix transcriptional regulator n=1 Tax=Aminipila butyrica TaxID=433296 RepID=A0A858BSK9_9FIRM|nr:helix-turn-helix transcriptional regulator [Aminipila butyrica]QIB68567.1 helix-turn-helix transcriptional regulator [Aminipila butyrica]
MKINKEKFEICLANNQLLFNDFCKKSGISKSSMRFALSGTRNTRPQTIGRIAETLGVSVEEIILKEGE